MKSKSKKEIKSIKTTKKETIKKSKTPKKSPKVNEKPKEEFDFSDPFPLDCKNCLQGISANAEDLKIVCWNVNGLRSVLRPSSLYDGETPLQAYVQCERPDVLILSETKLDSDLEKELAGVLDGYEAHFVSSSRKGYAGVAAFIHKSLIKDKELPVSAGLGIPRHDEEGRVISIDLPGLAVVGTYVPNAGTGLVRLDYRVKDWDKDLQRHLLACEQRCGAVVWCGDVNVAHNPIDLMNSKTNQRSAGHTIEERESFGEFLESSGCIDAYRRLYPRRQQFSFWGARGPRNLTENIGWRLDNVIVSGSLWESVRDVIIRQHVRGSDHCPMVLLLNKQKLDPSKT